MAGIGAMDFLIVPTVGFRLLFVLVILRHQRRRLISLTVTAHPTAEWIACQVTEAFPWDEAPDYLIRDRDASYGQVVAKRLAAMGIRDHPTAPRSPWQNGHAERLVGSIRRECLDHIVIFGEAHLRRILAAYTGYYKESERICHWTRMRRAIGQFDGSASSLLSRSSAAFIINTAGSSFRQAQVVTQPVRQGDVPTAPEIDDRRRLVRRVEVVGQPNSEHAGKTDRHVGIAGEIEIKAKRVGADADPGLRQRGSVGKSSVEDLVGDGRQGIGEQQFLGQAEDKEREPGGERSIVEGVDAPFGRVLN